MNTHKRFKKRWLQIILCSLLLVFSCTKEEKATKHDYPKVATGQVTNINTECATFNGSFLQTGNSEIIDHGFIFSSNDPPGYIYSEKISLGPSSGRGSFTATANFGLTAGSTYYVSAYAQNKDKIFYAPSVSFVSK